MFVVARPLGDGTPPSSPRSWDGGVYLLDEDQVVIGRSHDAGVQLGCRPGSGTVSRRHAVVAREGGVYRLTDLGSANGTYVEGVRLEPQQPTALVDGCTVSFGGAPGTAGAHLFEFRAQQTHRGESLSHVADDVNIGKEGEHWLRREWQCPICLDLIVAAHLLPCSHAFCGECIGKWERANSTCPVCREPAGRAVPARFMDKLVGAALEPHMDEEERDSRECRKRLWHQGQQRRVKQRRNIEDAFRTSALHVLVRTLSGSGEPVISLVTQP
jgi:hypothetical protein